MENNHTKQLTMLENVIDEDNNANLSEDIVIENNNDNSDDFMNIASFLVFNSNGLHVYIILILILYYYFSLFTGFK